MKRQHLLVAGLILVAASMLGPAVLGSSGGWPSGLMGWHMSSDHHMTGNGHMGWSGNTTSSDSRTEGARDIVVTATEFGFSPSEIAATAGESVNFVLVNEGRATHDLSIPDLGLRIVANSGEQATTGVIIDSAGTYQFICSIPGHAAAGMTGTIEVAG